MDGPNREISWVASIHLHGGQKMQAFDVRLHNTPRRSPCKSNFHKKALQRAFCNYNICQYLMERRECPENCWLCCVRRVLSCLNFSGQDRLRHVSPDWWGVCQYRLLLLLFHHVVDTRSDHDCETRSPSRISDRMYVNRVTHEDHKSYSDILDTWSHRRFVHAVSLLSHWLSFWWRTIARTWRQLPSCTTCMHTFYILWWLIVRSDVLQGSLVYLWVATIYMDYEKTSEEQISVHFVSCMLQQRLQPSIIWQW